MLTPSGECLKDAIPTKLYSDRRQRRSEVDRIVSFSSGT